MSVFLQMRIRADAFWVRRPLDFSLHFFPWITFLLDTRKCFAFNTNEEFEEWRIADSV